MLPKIVIINWQLVLVALAVLIEMRKGSCAPVGKESSSHESPGIENGSGGRNVRNIMFFHDDLTYAGPDETSFSAVKGKNKARRHIKLIPADESLRHRFYPEKVEQELGKIRIQRRLKRNDEDQQDVVELDNAIPKIVEDIENANEERIHDLEEVFQILAKRDGQLLDQMQSLKSAIERMVGIFEFMGVAKLPEPQRTEAVKKILERSYFIENAKKIKRKV